jgi:transposase
MAREAIQSAWTRLEALRARLAAPRPRWHARAAVAQATEKILGETGAARWIRYEVVPLAEAVFRQEKRGRPGKNTRWRRRLKTRFRFSWAPRQEIIDYDARCDGIFPLITNRKDEEASAGAVLAAYQSKQPLVEKRHDLLKNVQAATPMYLKNIGRMEALLFLEFVALMIHALIERQLRAAMKSRGISELPLYPEDRDCKAPSTDRVLEILELLQRHLLSKNGQVVQRFDPELNELQRRILGFLGVSAANFANC